MGFDLSTLLQGVSVGAPIAGGVLQARGLEQQADAAAQASLYNARLTEREGTAEASRRRVAGRREIARQRVALHASDLRVEGSPLDLLAANAAEVEKDAAFAQIEARRTAKLERLRAANTKRAARVGAGTALLSGGAQALQTGYSLGLFGRR